MAERVRFIIEVGGKYCVRAESLGVLMTARLASIRRKSANEALARPMT